MVQRVGELGVAVLLASGSVRNWSELRIHSNPVVTGCLYLQDCLHRRGLGEGGRHGQMI